EWENLHGIPCRNIFKHNKEWFSKSKLGMGLTAANQVIYVYENYKEFGLRPQDVSALGLSKMEIIMKKKLKENNNEPIKIGFEELKSYNKVSEKIIQGRTRADIVFSGVRGLSKTNKTKFWKLLTTLPAEDKLQLQKYLIK
ncbi:MAG TPA: hypothetical protein VMZ91_11660, partial [Candidatus Paceibacterota bacterium]|nr:hypothetical protein [Candidatus Paceibacterota bacterium]